MNVSPCSSGSCSVQTAQAVSTAVARKTLDQQQQQGDAVVALLEQAVELAQAPAQVAPARGFDLYA